MDKINLKDKQTLEKLKEYLNSEDLSEEEIYTILEGLSQEEKDEIIDIITDDEEDEEDDDEFIGRNKSGVNTSICLLYTSDAADDVYQV